MCGVYMLRCRANGFYYIGGTTYPFADRFDRHRTMLRRGKGPRLLQACYDLYSEESFDFIPLQTFPPEEVADREREAIERLKPDLNIYGVRVARPRRLALPSAKITFRGETILLQELAAKSGIGAATIRARYARGLTDEALVAPAHKAPRKPYIRRK